MKVYRLHRGEKKQAHRMFYCFLAILYFSFLLVFGTNEAYGQDAKYIILMIADGWGPKHIEAANEYTGTTPTYQSDTEWVQHWMSTFPYGGSYDTTQAWDDFNYVTQGATDSAAAATALYSGNKTANGRVSVSHDASQRFFTIGEVAKSLGKAVGAITTVPISDATPGIFCAHNDDRGNTYAIADECLFEAPNTTGTSDDPNDPTYDPKYAGGHGPTTPSVDVIIGDGREGYVNDAIRNKLEIESGTLGDPNRDTTKHYLVERQTGVIAFSALMAAANNPNVTKVAGLFDQIYRMADGSGYNSENPTLAESAIAALRVLNKNPNGFIVVIEGGAVDWAAHSNNMDQMIGEMIDFNEAVQAVIDWVNDPTNGSDWNNTLVIVTGDHECGYLTAGPDIFQDQPLGDVNDTTLALEKIISDSGGRRASWIDGDSDGVIDTGETVYWAWNRGGHTKTLIPLYARGVGAELFGDYDTGYDSVRGNYLDNTNVFFVMDSVIGNISPIANEDSAITGIDTPVNINVVANDTDSDGTIDPATVTMISAPTYGSAVANVNGTVSYTPNTGFTGIDTFTYTVKDNEGATSNGATVTVKVNVFVAYNDLSWSAGQVDNNITHYTTGQSGLLMDYSTGTYTTVTLAIAGGGSTILTQGSDANSGTDAHNVFNGIVDSVGLISYSSTNLTFTFTGLDPSLIYEFVLFGNRNNPDYTDRMTTTTISDVEYFFDSSTPGADFSGPNDASVTINNGYNTTNGYVARFTYIRPGIDGDMLITVSSADGYFYANALMLKATQEPVENVPPVATNDSATTSKDIPVDIDVVANDADPDGTIDPATVTVMNAPTNGAAVANVDGTVTYIPNTGFTGTDTFDYTVKDNEGATSNGATVTVFTTELSTARVEIDHTYRGDLVVVVGVGNVSSPTWSTTVSNRAGGSADNLYVDVDIAGGSAYLPPNSTNVWFLKVSDQAAQDTGTIRTFKITHQGQTYSSTDPPVAINDNQTSYAYIGGTAPPPTATARVEIDHTYRGDLVVVVGVGNVNSPTWSTTVSNRAGGSADNLYVDVDIAGGSAYLPPNSTNVWFLKVSDQAAQDTGTIRTFKITHQGQTYSSTDPPVAINDNQTSYAYIGGAPPPPPSATARVEIDHTYRGDLVVVVGVGNVNSPSWSTTVSNRAGGGADNLYVDVDISAGAAYLPPSSSNVWFLKVADQAAGDTGTIRIFRITYQGQTYSSTDPPVPINDFQTSYAYIGGTAPPPVINETFESGLPTGWTVIDNAGSGATWRFNDMGGRGNLTGGTGNFAIADSDYVGQIAMNTELRTPPIDMSGLGSVILQFKTDFRYYSGGGNEVADVDVSINGAAGPWTNVWRKSGGNYRGPHTESINISAIAAGQNNVMIRFHYYNANYDWWWQVDDVVIGLL